MAEAGLEDCQCRKWTLEASSKSLAKGALEAVEVWARSEVMEVAEEVAEASKASPCPSEAASYSVATLGRVL